ncbi:MAG: hypothetical protein KKB50_05195 [Planctomycetes bacterium]|nr:hypothetical protein [Planctomycetota bacterium]
MPRRALLAIAALAALIAALHGRALHYGLFMDDYVHFRQLQQCDWSLAGLTDACRLELVGGVINLWWMPECTLRFFRPVAFGLMKLTYSLTAWSPMAMHCASLAWHLTAATLLMLLLRRLGTARGLAWCVAALFAIHPGHVGTVQWIACQSELMVATLLLAATLCYLRFRTGSPAALGEAGSAGGDPATAADPPSLAWAAASVILFVLALGCRENAVMLPAVLLLSEPLLPRRRRRAGLFLCGVFVVAVAAYLAVRSHYLDGVALPPRPYVVPPSAPDFLTYVLDKSCYYLLGEFLLVPCVPIGGLAYFRDHPLAFYGLTAGVVGLVILVCLLHRRRLSALLGPAWLLGFLLPVLPAFESPHHLYLPSIGWALIAGLGLQTLGAWRGQHAVATRRRPTLAGICLLATGAIFAAATFFFGLAFDTAQAVEDQVVAEVAAPPRELNDGDTIYAANLPVIAHYLGPAVEHRTGRRNLRVAALTWSPRLLGMPCPGELVWIDQRTIAIRISEERYFAGPLGGLVAEARGGAWPLESGQEALCAGFRVEVLDGDDRGIRALRFIFDKNPTRAGLHLFWGSRVHWAMPVFPPEDSDG